MTNARTKSHYILIRDFLQPWAKKNGAKEPDWQAEVFADISEGGTSISYSEFQSDQGPRIEITGSRFTCKASRDIRRVDTLFIYEIHGRGGRGALKWKAHWELARGERWPPERDPLELMSGDAPLETNESLKSALERILGGLTIEELLGPMEAPTRPSGERTLLGLRRAYEDLESLLSYSTLDESAKHIMAGYLHPADDARVFLIRDCLDEQFLERVHRRRSPSLASAVRAVLGIPPNDTLLANLVEAWLVGGPPESLESRALGVVRWASKQGNESHRPPWPGVFVDARNSRIAANRNDRISPAFGRAMESWEALRKWATPEQVPVEASVGPALASANARQAGRVDQEEVPGEVREAAPHAKTAVPPTPGSPGATGRELKEMVRSRVRALRASAFETSRVAALREAEGLLADAQRTRIEVSKLPDPASLDEALQAAESLARRLEALRTALPERDELQGMESDVTEATDRWAAAGPLALPLNWFDRIQTWDEMKEVFSLLARETLMSLPGWFPQTLFPTEQTIPDALFASATTAATRAKLADAAAWIEQLSTTDGERPDIVAECARGPGEDPLKELQASYREQRESLLHKERIVTLARSLGPWASSFAETSALPASEIAKTLEGVAGDLGRCRTTVPALRDEITQLVNAATDPRNATEALNQLAADLGVLGDLAGRLGNLKDVRVFAAKFQGTPAPPTRQAVALPELDVAHCLSDGAGGVSSARLVARPDKAREGLHLTEIPLAIKSSLNARMDLEFEISLPHMEGRPAEWVEMGRRRSFTLSDGDWKQVDDGYSATIVLERIPVTKQRPGGLPLRRLELAIEGVDRSSGAKVRKREFAFDELTFDMPSLELPFSDTTSPEEMRRHPLGIQFRFDEIVAEMRAGRASLLISAPRRFGKTTLLNALMHEFGDSEVLVVGPVPAAALGTAAKAFHHACDELGRTLGVHMPAWEQGLPDEATFNAARERAAGLGKKAIYLVFDEAQALFSGKSGRATAELLKSRLETAWTRTTPKMVPLRLVLVGQLHLQRLIQGQLDAFFAARWVEHEIRPDNIERLLRESTRGVMQSTARARRLVANVSRNLYILRVILQEIRSKLNEVQRTWFVRQDVEAVVENYIQKALGIDASALTSYLRDPLNVSEDLTEWKPMRAYPVAVAWAVALGKPSRSRAAMIDEVRLTLERWAGLYDQRLNVPTTTIEEALQDLRDAVVTGPDDRFQSELLFSYFMKLGETDSPLRSQAERDALRSLSVDRVQVPGEAALTKVGEGGQATVFVQETEPHSLAWRLVDLPDEASHIAFVEMCHALKALEGTRARLPGYRSLAVVKQAGITAEARPRGAVVYEWVDGVDLSTVAGQLPDGAVVEIGHRIAEALVVLSSRGVVHRDVRPNNIIRGTDGVPVLVDFGLAKLASRTGNTLLEVSKYLAPEVRQTKPQWTSAADVYALAITLEEMRHPSSENERLVDIIKSAKSLLVAKRATAEALVAAFADLKLTMGLDDRRASLVEEFTPLIGGSAPQVEAIAKKSLQLMLSTKLGIFTEVESIAQAAAMVDTLYESWFLRAMGGKSGIPASAHLSGLASLGKGAPKELTQMKTNQAIATGHVRHAIGHRATAEDSLRRARAILGITAGASDGPLRLAVIETARKLDDVAKCTGLGTLVKHWLTS